MKKLLFLLISLMLTKSVYCSDWKSVYSGLDSISGFTQYNDKLLLFNAGGIITEVDLTDFSSNVINTQNRWIFSAVQNNNDMYISVVHPTLGQPSILKSTDYGKSWSEFIHDFGGNLFIASSGQFFGSDTCIFVGCDTYTQSMISYTFDGGKTSYYLKINDAIILLTIAKTNNTLFVGSGNGKVFKSTDFGQSWVEVDYFKQNNSSPLRSMKFKDNIGIAINQDGIVFKSEDSGETWNRIETGISGNYMFFHINIIDDKFIISGKNSTKGIGLLLISKDLGETWSVLFENDINFRGTFIYQNYLYCVSTSRNLWQADYNLVSVDTKIPMQTPDYQAITADNRKLNTNIKFDNIHETSIEFNVIDILGNKIGIENFKVLSQNPYIIDINANIPSGVYYLLLNNGLQKKVVKFLVL